MTAKLVLATPEQIRPYKEEADAYLDESFPDLSHAARFASMSTLIEFQLNQKGFTMYDTRATYKKGAEKYYGTIS